MRIMRLSITTREDETMSATPLIPGRLYRVRGSGLELDVIATHPCEALCIAIDILIERTPC